MNKDCQTMHKSLAVIFTNTCLRDIEFESAKELFEQVLGFQDVLVHSTTSKH